MAHSNFFAELKRRYVDRAAVAYVVVAWLTIQAASILLPTFEAPGWVMKLVVAVVVIRFPVALARDGDGPERSRGSIQMRTLGLVRRA